MSPAKNVEEKQNEVEDYVVAGADGRVDEETPAKGDGRVDEEKQIEVDEVVVVDKVVVVDEDVTSPPKGRVTRRNTKLNEHKKKAESELNKKKADDKKKADEKKKKAADDKKKAAEVKKKKAADDKKKAADDEKKAAEDKKKVFVKCVDEDAQEELRLEKIKPVREKMVQLSHNGSSISECAPEAQGFPQIGPNGMTCMRKDINPSVSIYDPLAPVEPAQWKALMDHLKQFEYAP